MTNKLWDNRRIIVCVGTGGVGKTTTAAALALAAAASGIKTLVMTIDPARRLANALGIVNTGNAEREVSQNLVHPYGISLQAPLSVMMLDVKHTFDSLVARLAKTSKQKKTILENRVYQQFTTALAGGLEYAAVEKLHEVYHSKRYELIILDTPPSQNTIDFLEAPRKMVNFLNSGTMQWTHSPSRQARYLSLKLLNVSTKLIVRVLGKMAGSETLREIEVFLAELASLYSGFSERHDAIRKLLVSPEVAFMLITTPHATHLRAMRRLRKDLRNEGIVVRAIICNRVRAAIPNSAALTKSTELALSPLNETAKHETLRILHEELTLAEQDQAGIEEMTHHLEIDPIMQLPELPPGLPPMAGLAKLQSALLQQTPSSKRLTQD